MKIDKLLLTLTNDELDQIKKLILILLEIE